MSNKNYNWWEDPKNKEQVDRISWWEHHENKTTVDLPVAIVNDGNYWCVGTNKETEKLLGKDLSSVSASGDTKEEAIANFFSLIRALHSFEKMRRLKYQRWVPFRKGNWRHTGGTWFVVFGIHVYFRYGKGMKWGWYVPFTKLNISVHNEWRLSTREEKQKVNHVI